jgi:tellurite resistance protein
MFLNLLDGAEKENFLELANFVANYNNDFAGEQQAMINQFRRELGLDEKQYKLVNKTIEVILESFNTSKKEVKNAVFTEIMALIISDGVYDKKEEFIATQIRKHLSISDSKYEEIITWIKDIKSLYSKGYELVIS